MKQENIEKFREHIAAAVVEAKKHSHPDVGRVADALADLFPDLLAEIERLNRVVDQAVEFLSLSPSKRGVVIIGGVEARAAGYPDLAAELRARAEKETSETSEVQP